MHEYAFDVSMVAVVRVTAPNATKAKETIRAIQAISINHKGDDYTLTEASVDIKAPMTLFEVDNKGV